jgi:Tfp pilus assembly protein PilF
LQKLILSLLLVLATLALYIAVVHAPFLNLDDDFYVVQNSHVRSGLNWHSVAWAFRTSDASNWHPLTWLSHELDCQMFGMNPAGPHLVNVLLHSANAVLLFLILANATGMMWRSLMVAAIFALHPINVESVAWISERKNVLSMLFFLLALAAYGWYARNPNLRRHLTVTLLYAMGLMAKPQVITFPFALLLVDYWPLGRLQLDQNAGVLRLRAARFASRPSAQDDTFSEDVSTLLPQQRSLRGLLWEKIPWFALSAASAVITMRVQRSAVREEVPLWEHVTNAALAYAKYIGKAFWPANLGPMYPHPGGSINIAGAVFSALGILAVSVLVVIFRRRGYLPVGWFWFLGTLVPMVGLVQVGIQAMADRYAYIPLLGIFVIVCWGVPDLLGSREIEVETRTAASAASTKMRRTALAALSVIVLSSLGFALHRQVNFWTDNFTLWRHTIDITGRNFLAEDSAANSLLVRGKVDEAMEYFRRAQAIRPGDPVSKLNIASYEQHQGKFQEAIQGYREVLKLTTDKDLLTLAQANLGYAEFAIGQFDSAKQDFEATLKLQPNDAAAYVGLGMLAQHKGDWGAAVQNFESALKIEPAPATYELLAQVLESSGQKQAAEAARAEAAKIVNRSAGGGTYPLPRGASPSSR